jgi:hypothetical protein
MLFSLPRFGGRRNNGNIALSSMTIAMIRSDPLIVTCRFAQTGNQGWAEQCRCTPSGQHGAINRSNILRAEEVRREGRHYSKTTAVTEQNQKSESSQCLEGFGSGKQKKPAAWRRNIVRNTVRRPIASESHAHRDRPEPLATEIMPTTP